MASFPLTPDMGERLLCLADQLVEIGKLQGRLAEMVEASDRLSPWLLKEALDLPGLVSARILSLLAKRPGMFIARDMLVYQADTTTSAIAGHLTLVRKALASIGKAGEMITRDGCYSLTATGAEALRLHCRANMPGKRDLDYPRHVLDLLAQRQASAAQVVRGPIALSDFDLKFMMSLSSFIPLESLSFRILQTLLETGDLFTSATHLAALTRCSVPTLKVTICRLRRTFADQGLPDPVESNRLFGYRLSGHAATLWPRETTAQ